MDFWNMVFLSFSVIALVMSAWVLYQQEFGDTGITGILGPKIYVFHDSPSHNVKSQFARIVLPVTFVNESPRGGNIIKMALAVSSKGNPKKHILGCAYEISSEKMDVEIPYLTFDKKISLNPFRVPEKGAVTKYLFFEANSKSTQSEELQTVNGLRITRDEWEFDLLIWTRLTDLYNSSISGSISFSDYDSGVLTYQRITDNRAPHIFYMNNMPVQYQCIDADLRVHFKKLAGTPSDISQT